MLLRVESDAPEGTRWLELGLKQEPLGSTGTMAMAGGQRRNGGASRGPSGRVRASRARRSASTAPGGAAADAEPDATVADADTCTLAATSLATTTLSMKSGSARKSRSSAPCIPP